MNETNPKTLSKLAAYLDDEEDAAPTNPQICYALECKNPVMPGEEYCPGHISKKPLNLPGLGEDAEAKAILKAQRLCTRCGVRPLVYGNANDGYCEPCMNAKKASLLPTNSETVADRLAISPKLNARQKAVLKSRQPNKPTMDDAENWCGMCRGGCGKRVRDTFYCPECRKSQADKNFALKPGEIEIYRGNVGKAEDKIVKQVVAIDATSIKIEPMTWMWADRIPDGAITWICGQPGNAKSLLTVEIAACASTGRDWPDGAKNTLGAVKVLMFCGEDDLGKTVIPRLKAAGADLKNIRFLDSKSFRGTVGDTKMPGRSIDLDQDMETLLDMLKAAPDVRLLVCDPITGIFGSKQLAKDSEVNPILEELVDLCKATGLTFLGVLHTPKRTTNSAIEKIAGGSSVAGKCRAAFMLSNDPESDDKHDHVMTLIKGNLTGKLEGMKYRTVPYALVEEGREFPIVKIAWGETTDMNADDVLVAQNSRKEEKDRQLDRCMAFLQTYLKDGPKRSPDVYAAAEQLEFGDTTVKRALKKLGGDHLDRRNKREGYWMTLTPGEPFPEPKPEPEQPQMALAANEEL